MKKERIHNKNYEVTQYIRACEQRAVSLKNRKSDASTDKSAKATKAKK